jgi:hypothetical protein
MAYKLRVSRRDYWASVLVQRHKYVYLITNVVLNLMQCVGIILKRFGFQGFLQIKIMVPRSQTFQASICDVLICYENLVLSLKE